MNRKKQKSLIYENKGVALISVMIAIAFVSILASALLYITCRNYQMKVMNLNSKDNFYETNGELTKVLTTLRNDVITSANPNSKMSSFYATTPIDSLTEVGVKNGTYDVLEVVKLSHSDAFGDAKNAQFDIDGDTFKFHSDTNTIRISKDPTNSSITIYELADLQVMQKSHKGYENRVKTDVTIKVQEVKGNSNAVGGVGDFSMILDSSLDITSANFSALAIYGNSYISSYGDGRPTLSDGKAYVEPGKSEDGKAAMNLSGQSRVSILGDYMVVYGDLVLSGNSCLQVGEKTKLTVYGDIIINDNATFICKGELFMLDEVLPGRTAASDIYVTSGAKENHVYPSTLSPSTSDMASYQLFCETIHLSDGDSGNLGSDNIGLISKIMDSFNYTTSDYDGTLSFNDIQGKGAPHAGEKTTSTFYGQNCGVMFNGHESPNGTLTDFLVMDMTGNVQLKQSNTRTTFISKAPIKVSEVHDIMFTKVGGNLFKYLSVDSDDTSNPYYNTSIHKFNFKVNGFGNDVGQISVGDFFKDDCDTTVKNMLTYSTGGTGGGVSTYYSSMQFDEFSKDWN